MTVIITLIAVGVAVLFILFLAMAVMLFLMYREIRELRNTQDVIFNTCTNTEELMAAMAQQEAFLSSQN